MIIQHRETSDGNREDSRKFLQATIDPFFTVDRAFAQEEGAPNAAGDAVIPARN
jgi:hypothetical protein